MLSVGTFDVARLPPFPMLGTGTTSGADDILIIVCSSRCLLTQFNAEVFKLWSADQEGSVTDAAGVHESLLIIFHRMVLALVDSVSH